MGPSERIGETERSQRDVSQPTVERERLTRQVAQLEETCAEKEAELLKLRTEIAERARSIAERDRKIAMLESMQSGILWDLFCAYRGAKNRCFPHGTRRRAWYDFILGRYKALKRANPVPSAEDPFPNVMSPSAEPPVEFLPLTVRPRPSGGPASMLFISDWLPAMDRASGALRMFTMLQMLREQGYTVVFGADRERPEHLWLFGSEKEVSRYEAMLGGLGIMVSYGFRDVIRHLREKGHQYDFVLLSFPEVAYRYLPCARAFAVNAQILYDPVDLHWVRLEREATAKGDDGARQKSEEYKKIERFNTSAADLVIAITEEEKEHLLREVPNACIEVVPNIHECVDGAKPLSGRKDLLFIGHFMHTPNEDAVSYFVKEIFPLIRRELSDVRFHIVGSSMTDGIKSLDQPGVIPVGYVPEPSDYFDRCRVFVAPLRYGAGMKGKIGQSMSFGLPVVTTSIGAEGMQVIDRKHLLIADSAEDFARAVVELCVDDRLWEKLSAESLAHVKAHFSKTAVREKLAKVFAATGRDLRSDTIDPMNTQSWNGQAAVTSEDR